MSNNINRKSCEYLGVCQGSGMCYCETDTLPPGPIEESDQRTLSIAETLFVYFVAAVALVALCVIIGFRLGYLHFARLGWPL